jgi:CRISPR-associated protein Cas2
MICWVLYDIKKNKSRDRVAKICKQSGLYRVQRSVFLGSLEENEKDTLEIAVNGLIDDDTDSVYIFPMSRNELRQTVLLGQAFDKKMITDELKALYF